MSGRRFRFGRQDEDADTGSRLFTGTEGNSKWWRWICSWCSHINPPKAEECEICGYERAEDQ